MDVLNITALVTSVIAMFAVFIKHIRKCKCGTSGFEIERRDELDRHHSFIIQLLSSLKTNFTPRRYRDAQASQTIKDSNSNTGKVVPPLRITKDTTTGDIAKEFNMIPKKNGSGSVSVPIIELMENNNKKIKNKTTNSMENITPFVIKRKD